MEKEVKIKKFNKLLIPIIIGTVLLIGGLLFYFLVLNSPKYIFLGSINNEFKGISNLFDNGRIIDDSLISSEGELKITSTTDKSIPNLNTVSPILDELNKLLFNYNVSLDRQNKKMQTNLGVTYDKEEALNLNMVIQNDKSYLFLKNIYDKYIEVPKESLHLNFEADNPEIIKYLMNFYKMSFINSVDNKDFTKTTEVITFNNEKINTDKINYNLTQEKIKNIVIKMLEDTIKDKEAIKDLAILFSEKEDAMLNSVKDLIQEKKNQITDENVKIVLSVNTYGFFAAPIKYSLNSTYKTDSYDESNLIEYTNYNNNKSIIFYTNNEKVFEFKKEKISDVKSKIDINIPNVLTAEINEQKDNQDIKINYLITPLNQMATVSGNVDFITKEISPNKEYDNTLKITAKVTAKMNNSEVMSFELLNSNKIKYGTQLKDVDVSNSIKSEEITIDENLKIQQNIMNNKLFTNLFSSLMGMNTYTGI